MCRTTALLRSITREEYFDPKSSDMFGQFEAISNGRWMQLPFRRTRELPPEKQEELWQAFRRDHIP